jgi:RNA-binding protein YlmH
MIKGIVQRIFNLISKEEYNRLKQELDEVNTKIVSLTEINKSLTEMKDKKKDRDTLEEGFRYDMISHLHEGIYFKSNEEKNKSIESFAKSKMSFQDITTHLNQVRSFRSGTNTTTKLP